MPNDPQILEVLITTAALGCGMTWLAARMSMIELRRPQRCPACGRERIKGACGCTR
jgi:hypothetical protein